MASSSYQTHYEVLGITQNAELKEVRDAYHKLALKRHPDKDPRNPRAVAAFQKLGTAYETLSDENRRTKYDATLASSQRTRQPPQPSDWPLQRQPDTNATTRAWRDDMQRRAWDWSRRAQERADQARREDDKFWTGPTYAHSNPRSGWGKERDREQKDWQDLYDQKQRQRAARKEACKEADRKKRDMNTPPPPPPGDQFDQGTEEFKARAGRYKKKQEAQEKAQRERREDDGYWGKPPSPQQPEPDWSDRVEKEYQETLEKEKRERADRRKAEKEKHEKEGPAELPFLLIEIIAIKVEIDKNEAKSHESKRQTTDEREDEDHEQIFDLPIKRRSLERRLKESVDDYKRIVKLLRARGREQEANEAEVKLCKARKEVSRDERAGRKGGWQGEQAESTTKTKAKAKAEKDRAKPSANSEGSYPDPKSTTPQPSKYFEPRGRKRSSAEQPLKTTLPMYDGQSDGDRTRQQQPSRDCVGDPKVSYDGSDPDRGFTEDTPESSIDGDNHDYDDEHYDPPFCNDFHDSHMEVHREFWDIVDDWHECDFCHQFCTVMRCPQCDVQACAYCKDTHG